MTSLIARLWSRIRAKKPTLSIMLIGLDSSGKTSLLNYLATINSCRSSSRGQTVCKSSSSSQTLKQDTTEDGAQSENQNEEGLNRSSGNILPTVGYNYERIQYRHLTFTVLDFSGQNRYRNLWQEFFNGVDAIVFVIDSSDLIRLVVVRDELETMLNHPYFISLTDANTDDIHDHRSFPPSLTQQRQITINQGKLIQSPLETSPNSVTARAPESADRSLSKRLTCAASSGADSSRRRNKVPILFLANKCDLANSVDTEVIIKALNLNQLPVDRHPWSIKATSVSSNQGIVEAFDWLVFQLSTPIN